MVTVHESPALSVAGLDGHWLVGWNSLVAVIGCSASGALPELRIVTLLLALAIPMACFPKSTVNGEKASAPALPVPARVSRCAEPPGSVTVNAPDRDPAARGRNVIWTLHARSAASLSGASGQLPVAAKSPLVANPARTRSPRPALWIVTDLILLWPTGTLSKSMLPAGWKVSWPSPRACPTIQPPAAMAKTNRLRTTLTTDRMGRCGGFGGFTTSGSSRWRFWRVMAAPSESPSSRRMRNAWLRKVLAAEIGRASAR